MEDTSELLEAWVHNPYTRKLRAEYESCERKALEALLQVCENTSDPDVSAMYTQYKVYQEITSAFRSGTK